MVIAVYGRDGSGKTNLAKALGRMLAEKSLTAIINTDLTMPTTILPNEKLSLGNFLFSNNNAVITTYLHQDMRTPTLFWSGTTAEDDIYSYETYLSYMDNARAFIQQCDDELDNVVVDLSGQRVDPFLPGAFMYAKYIIVLATCDPAGANYLHSIKRLLKDASNSKVINIKYMLTKLMPYQDVIEFEKITGCKISGVLPYVHDIIQSDTVAQQFTGGGSSTGQEWQQAVKKLYTEIVGGGSRGRS